MSDQIEITVAENQVLVVEIGPVGVRGPAGASGGANKTRRGIAASDDIEITDQIIVYTGDSDGTLTLPSADGDEFEFTIKKTGDGAVTIAAQLGEFIEDAASIVLSGESESVDLFTFNGAYYVK